MSMTLDGFLLINKLVGPTSFDIVAKIRRKFFVKKVGHCGTLDPLAEGLLVLAIGKATRLIQYLNDDKTYEFGINFGRQTDTGDREGKIIKECEKIPSKEELLEAIPKFIGEISQIPPAFSAIKINGKRAYELAREGKFVEMKPHNIKIYSLNLLSFDFEQKTASFRISCSSGTYVRSLAKDLAQSCETLGFCSFIKRTRVGNFDVANAVEAQNAAQTDIIPVEKSIILPEIELNEVDSDKIKNGNIISASFKDISRIWLKHNGEIIALSKIENGFVKPISVFN